MSEQEKKRLRIYDLRKAETNPKGISKIIGVSLLIVYKPKKFFFTEK